MSMRKDWERIDRYYALLGSVAERFGLPKYTISAKISIGPDELPVVSVDYHPLNPDGSLMIDRDALAVITRDFLLAPLADPEPEPERPPFDVDEAIAAALERVHAGIEARRVAHVERAHRDEWAIRGRLAARFACLRLELESPRRYEAHEFAFGGGRLDPAASGNKGAPDGRFVPA